VSTEKATEFILRAVSVEKLDYNNLASADVTDPPTKPSDPSDFKVPKWPSLKITDIMVRFEIELFHIRVIWYFALGGSDTDGI
jgi:hypothetical protein